MTHMPLCKVKSPGNVNAFNQFLETTVNFDLIDTAEITNAIAYIPEMDPISLNFQNAGFENNLIAPALGFLFYIVQAQIGFVLVQLILILISHYV